jgi:hypothetical protein
MQAQTAQALPSVTPESAPGHPHPDLFAELLANPEGERPLAELRRLAAQSPAEGATLMEYLAQATADADPVRACRWLTVAAAVWSDAAGDAKRAARALRAAIDVCPTDEDALVQLTRLYRDNGKHRPLARLLERRAESLLEEAGDDPSALARAAEAFTALGHLLRDPPLDSPTEAIAAYNCAIATNAAGLDTFRAARELYLEAEQSADALPLFALEREHCEDPDQLATLYREEAHARRLAGDAAGATAVLRLAHKLAPDAPGLAEDLWRSVSDRIAAGETVLPEERAEAADILAGAAARMEAKALPEHDLPNLKLAFALATRALTGAPRAAELVRQAEVLVGLGAERPLALRHAEPSLAGLTPEEVAPLLQRLEAVAGPDEAVELHQRAVERAQSPETRVPAVEAAVRAAVKRGGPERIQQLFESIVVHCADEPSLSALEKAASDADKTRGGTVVRGLLAAALAAAEPVVVDGGRARAALLRRAARIARRHLGDPDQAFEWLGDALFARLEGALEDALEPLQEHVEALRKSQPVGQDGGHPRAPGQGSPPSRPAPPLLHTPSVPPPPPPVPKIQVVAARGQKLPPPSLPVPRLVIKGPAPLEPSKPRPPTPEPPAPPPPLTARVEVPAAPIAPAEPPAPAPIARVDAPPPPPAPPVPIARAEAPSPLPPAPTPTPPSIRFDAPPLPAPAPPAPPPPPAPPVRAEAPAPPPPAPAPPVPPVRAEAPSPPPPPPPPPTPPRPATLPPGSMARPDPGVGRTTPAPPVPPPPPLTPLPPPAGRAETYAARLGTMPPAPPVPGRPATMPPPPPPVPQRPVLTGRPPTIPPPTGTPLPPPVGHAPVAPPPEPPAPPPPPPPPPVQAAPPSPPLVQAPHPPVQAAPPPPPPPAPSAPSLTQKPLLRSASSRRKVTLQPLGPGEAPRAPVASTPGEFPKPAVQPVGEVRDPFAPAPAPPAPQRTSGDELIADLFQDMHELDFCADSMEGAIFTLALAMEKLGTGAGMVHLYDIDQREFVVVHAAGPGASILRGLRTADTDPLAADALRTRGAVLIADASADTRTSGQRWAALRNAMGQPIASVASARVALAGRFLGLIELVHAAGGSVFEAGDEHALSYIAERFTEFVAAHGVMLGDDA